MQFQGVALDVLPRVYLASPIEVAKRLRQTEKGRGDTILYERKAWTDKAWAAGTVDEIPQSWRFSEETVTHFFGGIGSPSYGGGSV